MRASRLMFMVATFASTAVGGIIWGCGDLLHSTDFERPDAGPPGEPYPFDFSKWKQWEAQLHAQQACTRLLACENGFGEGPAGTAGGQCMKNALMVYDVTTAPNRPVNGATRDFWDCLWRATACGGDRDEWTVTKCVTGGAPFACPDGGTATFMNCQPQNGGVLVECLASRETTAVDPCIATGRTCRSDQSYKGGAACVSPASNDGGACFNGCDGTKLRSCTDGGTFTYDRGVDCAFFGDGQCVSNDAGAACKASTPVGGKAETCTPSTAVSCNGLVAHGCASGVAEYFNCGALGLTCLPEKASEGPGWDVSRVCGPAKDAVRCTTDTCVGDTMQFCINGRRLNGDITCSSLGLKPCIETVRADGTRQQTCGGPL